MSTANLPATRQKPGGLDLNGLIRDSRERLMAVLPEHLTPERLTQLLYVLVPKTKNLAKCVPESIVACLVQVGSLDLDLTPGRNEAFLIPRWNDDLKAYECTFMPGYKGLEKLAVRTEVVRYVESCEVCVGDTFRVLRTNDGPKIEHDAAYQAGRGVITHLYTMAHMYDGGITVEVMTAEECEEIHQRSESAKTARAKGWEERGPWVTDWKEMALKTVLKRHCKRFPHRSDPKSEKAFQQLQAAIDADNTIYPELGAIDPPAKPDNQSGFGQGMYASPEDTQAYLDSLKSWLEIQNGRWLDYWQTRCNGEVPEAVAKWQKGDLLNVHQADGHLLKWCVETGRLDRSIVPEEAKARQLGRYVAIVYHQSKADRKSVGKEMETYAALQWQRQMEAVLAKHPELAEPEDASQDSDPESDFDAGRLTGED